MTIEAEVEVMHFQDGGMNHRPTVEVERAKKYSVLELPEGMSPTKILTLAQ